MHADLGAARDSHTFWPRMVPRPRWRGPSFMQCAWPIAVRPLDSADISPGSTVQSEGVAVLASYRHNPFPPLASLSKQSDADKYTRVLCVGSRWTVSPVVLPWDLRVLRFDDTLLQDPACCVLCELPLKRQASLFIPRCCPPSSFLRWLSVL